MNKNLNKILINIIQIVEKLTGSEIIINMNDNNNLKNSKSSARYLLQVVKYLDLVTNFKARNVFEIGANYGQDANFLKNSFGLNDDDVYVFEPHPDLFREIKKLYNFHCFELAVTDKNRRIKFHTIDLSKNSGMSSLRVHVVNNKKIYQDIKVQSMRMDFFISKNDIKSIDFLKIDVEGSTFEVLKGFGNRLSLVKSLQIETEFIPMWKGQKSWMHIFRLLTLNGFQLIDYKLQEDGIQADSFWIQKKYVRHKIYSSSSNKWKKQTDV